MAEGSANHVINGAYTGLGPPFPTDVDLSGVTQHSTRVDTHNEGTKQAEILSAFLASDTCLCRSAFLPIRYHLFLPDFLLPLSLLFSTS